MHNPLACGLSHARGKTILNRFLTPSRRSATLHYPERAKEVSLRLGHLRGKTVINCFLTPSGRFATSKRQRLLQRRSMSVSLSSLTSIAKNSGYNRRPLPLAVGFYSFGSQATIISHNFRATAKNSGDIFRFSTSST